jgi:hypothetical protein
MDEDLKQYLDTQFASIDTKLTELENNLMERVAGRIDAVEARMKAFIGLADHNLETRVITEFHK